MGAIIILKRCATGATESTLVVNRLSTHKIQEGHYDPNADESSFQVTIKGHDCSWLKIDAMVDGLFQAHQSIRDGQGYVWEHGADWCAWRARRGEFGSPMVVKKLLRDAIARIAAKHRLPGTESEWLPLGEFTLEGPQLYLVDPGLSGSDLEGVKLDSPAGVYGVFIRSMAFGRDHRVSRLRVVLRGSKPSLGPGIGKCQVDTGRFLVCDHRAFSKVRAETEAAGLKAFFGNMSECGHGVARLSGVPVYHTESGFGDGSYPIFELREATARVGAEVEFIRANEDYPKPEVE